MTIKIYNGDCRIHLKEIEESSIDLVVTSPPYWGLRDYGEETKAIWGGGVDCEHEWGSEIINRKYGNVGSCPNVGNQIKDTMNGTENQGSYCQTCGAWYGQLGLEPTWQEYIKHLVEISNLIKSVLKKSGSYYLNLGDTYCSSMSAGSGGLIGLRGEKDRPSELYMKQKHGFKRQFDFNDCISQPKQKLLIPHRVAIALQESGWILRNDIIWHKPNHMPSSVKDRLTNSFEFVFHLVKSRKYYYDLDKIREPHKEGSGQKGDRIKPIMTSGILDIREEKIDCNPKGKNPGDVINLEAKQVPRPEGLRGQRWERKTNKFDERFNEDGKNPSDFWEINTQPFPEAHFAVFPEELVERIIKSSCPKDGIVLDPFCGSGTTLRVAKELGIRSIGMDINKKYVEMSKKRCGLSYDITVLNPNLRPLSSYEP
jgi:site-specific DNA-methyltransferase (cytosine-N4-specific)